MVHSDWYLFWSVATPGRRDKEGDLTAWILEPWAHITTFRAGNKGMLMMLAACDYVFAIKHLLY